VVELDFIACLRLLHDRWMMLTMWRAGTA